VAQLRFQNEQEIIELISEVSSEKPNHERLRVLLKKYNIEFSDNPLEQMSLVLKHFHQLTPIRPSAQPIAALKKERAPEL